MSNSFNISVKPEIALLEAKVDIVDTEVDAVRSTDVVNIQTNINANETKIDANKDVVDLIRGTDVPNIQTNIDANETKIDLVRDPDILGTNALINALNNFSTVDNLKVSLVPSDVLVHANPDEFLGNNDVYTKLKETKFYVDGIVRVYFSIRSSVVTSAVFGKIYINGAPIGAEHTHSLTTYETYYDDVVVEVGDLVQIYVHRAAGASNQYCKDLNICGDPSGPGIIVS